MGKSEKGGKVWNIHADCLEPVLKMVEQYATGKAFLGSVEVPSAQEFSRLLLESRFSYAIGWLKANLSAELGNQISEMVNESMREMKSESFSPATRIRVEQFRALVNAVRVKTEKG